jgi:hypothetical protein
MQTKSRRKEFSYETSDKTNSGKNSTSDKSNLGKKITRREAMSTAAKAAVGAVVVVVAGAGAYEYYTSQQAPTAMSTTSTAQSMSSAAATSATTAVSQPFAGQSLRWLGPSFMIDDNIVGAYEKESGVNIVDTVTDLDTIRSKGLTGGAQEFDEFAGDSAIWLAWKAANVTKRFAPSNIARWDPSTLYELWTNPDTVIGTNVPPPLGPTGPYIAKSVIWPHVWADTPGVADPTDDYGQINKTLFMAPLCWNYDACLINPTYTPELLKNMDHDTVLSSWEIMYDRKYVGKSAILDSVATVTNHVAAYLVANKLMSPPAVGCNDLQPSEMDTVVNFLIAQKKAGQFRTTWSDFMTLVNLYTTGEIWVSDAWQPVEYPVRAAGTPAYYIEPVEGFRSWLDGNAPTTGDTSDALVYDHINWQYGPWYAVYILVNGYHTPFFNGDEIKNAMGPERWGWVYGGQPTYTAFTPAQQPLFAPQTYTWSMTPGTPDTTNGNYKDCGSIQERTSKVAVWGRVPHDLSYYIEAWSKFRAA